MNFQIQNSALSKHTSEVSGGRVAGKGSGVSGGEQGGASGTRGMETGRGCGFRRPVRGTGRVPSLAVEWR